MFNLLSGIERFGLEANVEDITKDTTKDENESADPSAPIVYKEEDFLFLKSFECPVCDAQFKSPVLKTGKSRRKEPDIDLRPRMEHIDPNKYDIVSCPKCGFTSMQRYFGHLMPTQKKWLREQLCSKLPKPPMPEMTIVQTIDYDTAIDFYKLSLYGTVIKKGHTSEKAYTCLKIAWLLRGKMEELAADDVDKNKVEILQCRSEYQTYYKQAFEGFVKAMSSENYPMCGMDQNTVDLLIAGMAYNLGKYDYASRFVSSLILSRTAGQNIKKRARDLKDKIIEKLNAQK